MGLLDLFKKRKSPQGQGLDTGELARRLGVDLDTLISFQPRYTEFNIPKRGGGQRRILAPERPLKSFQRVILRRVLALLVSHPAANGFERGKSIITNARLHIGKPVVVRMDIRDFFTSTTDKRAEHFFRRIGWDKPAAKLLTKLCTYEGGLPQGAPTSPRLANLVNYRLDTRLDRLAAKAGAMYSRYADDLTFSFDRDEPGRIRSFIRLVRRIVSDEGYHVHKRRKMSVRRRHQQQCVTGLVVNERINLPRATRRRLRAIAHNLANGRSATLTETQMQGWRAFRQSIEAPVEVE
ncbi:MAG: RNA-directed DNA polymerase [Phycisphaerales bacterium]|nr:MAG: RNA-directed DNA polymerase [Phycisphaerales bacterium]